MMSHPPYFPCYAEDAMTGVLRAAMTPEQVGCYFMLLCMEWIEQAPIAWAKDEDFRRVAICTGWDIRLVKRLVREVVAKKKYTLQDGKLSNARMQAEITKYVDKVRDKKGRRSDAAETEAEHTAKQTATGAAGARAKPIATDASVRSAAEAANQTAIEIATGVATEDLFRKPSEINDAAEEKPRAQSLDTHAISELRTQNLEIKDKKPLLSEGEKSSPDGSPPRPSYDDASPRARRLPADWTLPPEWRAQTLEKFVCTPEQVDRQAERFANHWLAKGGADARKVDWHRTWLNWVDKEFAKRPSIGPAGKPKAKKPPPPRYWWRGQEEAARRGNPDGWEEFILEHANGHWPVEYLGPLPGTPECLVPESVVKKLNLIERYGSKEHHG